MLSLHCLVAALSLSITFSISTAQTIYNQPCPLLGLTYPKPSGYASNAAVQSAMQSLQGAITGILNNASSPYGTFDYTTTAFAANLYSLHDENSLFSYYYTPDALKAKRTAGVESIDSNTIFRIGSVSKLFTVYLYLIAAGDETWNQPITRFIPELASYAQQNKGQASQADFDIVDWDSITIGALASQLAGISRDAAYSPQFEAALESLGVPPPPGDTVAACGDDIRARVPCNRTAFFNEYLRQHPVVPSFTTPVYSNAAYQMLAYAVENITGIPVSDLFEKSLVTPLGLNSTSYTNPSTDDNGFIPGNATSSWWSADLLDEIPAGGYFSSINDMRSIGKSILNSTLLAPAQTRRWMKPHSFTSNVNYSVGAPWEIRRAPGDAVMWVYTKSGDIGAYAAIIALLPEYDIGFTVLAAGTDGPNAVRVVADQIATISVPAIQSAGATNATSVYDGTYIDAETNSTITLRATATAGLLVTAWTFKGQDILSFMAELQGFSSPISNWAVTLQYTSLRNNNGTVTSWRLTGQIVPQQDDIGPGSEDCSSWETVNIYNYGGVGLEEFLITLDATGSTAISIQPRALGENLLKAAPSRELKMPRQLRRVKPVG